MKLLAFCSIFSLVAATLVTPALAEEAQPDKVLASIDAAAQRWRSACTDKAADESCIVARSRTRQHSCQKQVIDLTLGKRDSKKAARAHKSLVLALARLPSDSQSENAQAAIAEARYLVAQAALADFLEVKGPRGLNFDARDDERRKRSTKAFLDFFNRAKSASRKATDAFQEVTELPKTKSTAFWQTASLAQRARIYRHFAELLYAMEIPIDVRTGPYAQDATDAFCDTLADKAAPLEALAIDSAQACLRFNRDAAGAWVARCQELQSPIGVLTDASVVRRIVRDKMSAFTRCYEEAKRDDSDLLGTMNLQLQIGSDGQVLEASATGIEHEALRSCVTLKARSLLFPPALGTEPTVIDYPLRFGVLAPR